MKEGRKKEKVRDWERGKEKENEKSKKGERMCVSVSVRERARESIRVRRIETERVFE